jgi:hypothetical protein
LVPAEEAVTKWDTAIFWIFATAAVASFVVGAISDDGALLAFGLAALAYAKATLAWARSTDSLSVKRDQEQPDARTQVPRTPSPRR